MKTILVFVSTLDGKVTKWGDPFVRIWSSKADKEYFNRIWKDNKLIVMGSNTYNAHPIKPSKTHLLIIMTRNTSKYRTKVVDGQIEFTDMSPVQLVARYEKQGKEQMLIAGGAQIATSFLNEELIDEVWLTFEPIIFGLGGNFVTAEKLDINLNLLSCEKVNEQGTLITKYSVIKNTSVKSSHNG